MALTLDTQYYGTTTAVTGFYVNGADCIPKSTTITGTITSTNTSALIVGVATEFTTEIQKGDTLMFTAGGAREYHIVREITDDLNLILATIPAAAAAGVTASISRPMFRKVRIQNTAGGAATVQGQSLPASASIELDIYGATSKPELDVISYNSTGTTLLITTI